MNSPNEKNPNSVDDAFIQTYLDGDASSAQEDEITRLLEDPAFCERLANYALDSACLHDLAEQGALGQFEGSDCETLSSVPLRKGASPSTKLLLGGAALLLTALVIALVIPHWTSGTTDEQPVAKRPTLGQLQGVTSAVIHRQGADNLLAVVDSVLRSGDILKTMGPEGFATLVFNDGTTLMMAGDAKVSLAQDNGQKRIEVLHGDVDANVMKQPDEKPMLFVTSLAEARVMGTRLSISADTNGTTLSVSEGHVVMKRLSDGRSIDVRGGYHAIAAPNSELAAQQTPPTPDVWARDFEDGLPDDWRIGQWVTDDLPEDSQGAVRSARWKTGPGLYYAIRSNRTTTGLFQLHEDTHLNFTYKLERPGWFNLFVVVHDNEADRSGNGNFVHNEPAWWRIPTGEWRTVSVPLTKFHKAVPGRSKGDKIHVKAGGTVNSIWFSTPKKDRGLLIDRLWVTRGDPTVATHN